VVTRIALNYVAAGVGFDRGTHAAFDDRPEFRRHGREKPRSSPIRSRIRGFQRPEGELRPLVPIKDMIVVQLSILMRMQYFVVLAESATTAPSPRPPTYSSVNKRLRYERSGSRGVALKSLKT